MLKFLVILCTFLCISKRAFAYIDPGTGSMLFSIVLGSITTVFFFVRVVIIHVKRYLFKKNSLTSRKHQFVVYSEGNQYYTVFKPVLDEFESRKIPVMYYSSSSDDLLFQEGYSYVKVAYIGKGNKAYLKLAFLNADVCVMTTPQLDVLQLKRSRNVKHYSHIFHAIAFSYSYRLFSLDYYDSVLCDAEYQVPMIRELEHKRKLPEKKLPVVGSTYMDFNKQRLKDIKIDKKTNLYTILIASTWGEESLLNKYGEKLIDQFLSSKYYVIIRPHPQSFLVDRNLIDKLQKRYKDCPNISWDMSVSSNLESMAESDLLITDWSRIMVDYALLFKRTFLYTGTNVSNEVFDCHDLLDPYKWTYDVISQIGKKLYPEDMGHVVRIIDEIKNDVEYKEKLDMANEYFWAQQGRSAKNVVDFLVDIQKSLRGN